MCLLSTSVPTDKHDLHVITPEYCDEHVGLCVCMTVCMPVCLSAYHKCYVRWCTLGWLGSRVVSVLDSGAEGPGSKS